MKKKIYFVNGALGSGKTTLINQLILSGKLGKFFIIENEVSSFSVDNMCLHIDPKQMKVFAGECICCSDPKELVNVLEKVASEDYENVVIESSGVTSLNQLLTNILVEQKLDEKYEIGGCVFLVDALGIGRTNVNDLEISDFVVVTKYDELKNIDEYRKLDEFIKKDFAHVNFEVKQNLNDAKWIDKLSQNISKSFRDWALKVNDEKHHGQNFVRVISGSSLVNLDIEKIYGKMVEKNIYRVKGFYPKNGLIYHVEMTPELKKVDVSAQTEQKNLGVVLIGGNKLLLDELIEELEDVK
jgi:G3E family GTPase